MSEKIVKKRIEELIIKHADKLKKSLAISDSLVESMNRDIAYSSLITLHEIDPENLAWKKLGGFVNCLNPKKDL